jgi:hypothetical protein
MTASFEGNCCIYFGDKKKHEEQMQSNNFPKVEKQESEPQ